jgi:hypothetical protein
MLAASTMISLPVHAATISIKVGVTTSFAGTANDIVSAFAEYYLKGTSKNLSQKKLAKAYRIRF